MTDKRILPDCLRPLLSEPCEGMKIKQAEIERLRGELDQAIHQDTIDAMNRWARRLVLEAESQKAEIERYRSALQEIWILSDDNHRVEDAATKALEHKQ